MKNNLKVSTILFSHCEKGRQHEWEYICWGCMLSAAGRRRCDACTFYAVMLMHSSYARAIHHSSHFLRSFFAFTSSREVGEHSRELWCIYFDSFKKDNRKFTLISIWCVQKWLSRVFVLQHHREKNLLMREIREFSRIFFSPLPATFYAMLKIDSCCSLFCWWISSHTRNSCSCNLLLALHTHVHFYF